MIGKFVLVLFFASVAVSALTVNKRGAADTDTDMEADAESALAAAFTLEDLQEFAAHASTSSRDPDPRTGYDENLAKTAADYSSAAYYKGNKAKAINEKRGNTDNVGLKSVREIEAQDTKKGLIKGKAPLGAYTAYDQQNNKIVVAFKGTTNTGQLLNEVGGSGRKEIKDCPGCKTTEYFADAANKMQPQIDKQVAKLQKKYKDSAPEVVVTGHSLGGAMAQQSALHMKNKGLIGGKDANGKDQRVDVYTFGQPKAGNKKFNDEFNKAVPNSYRVVHDNDVIPKVGVLKPGKTSAGHQVHYGKGMADGDYKIRAQGDKKTSDNTLGKKNAAGEKNGKLLTESNKDPSKKAPSGFEKHSNYFGPMGNQFKNRDQEAIANAAGPNKRRVTKIGKEQGRANKKAADNTVKQQKDKASKDRQKKAALRAGQPPEANGVKVGPKGGAVPPSKSTKDKNAAVNKKKQSPPPKKNTTKTNTKTATTPPPTKRA